MSTIEYKQKYDEIKKALKSKNISCTFFDMKKIDGEPVKVKFDEDKELLEPLHRYVLIKLEHEGQEIGYCNGYKSSMPTYRMLNNAKYDEEDETPAFNVKWIEINKNYAGKKLGTLLLLLLMLNVALRDKDIQSYYLDDASEKSGQSNNIYDDIGYVPWLGLDTTYAERFMLRSSLLNVLQKLKGWIETYKDRFASQEEKQVEPLVPLRKSSRNKKPPEIYGTTMPLRTRTGTRTGTQMQPSRSRGGKNTKKRTRKRV